VTYKFAVITKIPADGNCSDELLVPRKFKTGWDSGGEVEEELFTTIDNPTAEDVIRMIRVRLPVFSLGEILIVNDIGREFAGKGRKPSKWNVEYEEFDTIEQAIDRAKAL
jgi:hypothetical protein